MSKYPPAKPEALRLLAPQRGLIATDRTKSKGCKCELAVGREPHERTEAHSRKCQTLDASPAEPGELPND